MKENKKTTPEATETKEKLAAENEGKLSEEELDAVAGGNEEYVWPLPRIVD